MSREQTANVAEKRQPLPEPDIAACNFLEVDDFPGRVLARRFILDPSLPVEHIRYPHLKAYCENGLDIDLWIRSVDGQNFVANQLGSKEMELIFEAGQDARVRLHTMGNQPFCLTVAATGGTVQLEIPETYRGTIILSKPHAPVLDLSPGICEHLSVSKAEFWDKTSTELVITNKPDCVDDARHDRVHRSVLILAHAKYKSISIAFTEEQWTAPVAPDSSWRPLQWLSSWYKG